MNIVIFKCCLYLESLRDISCLCTTYMCRKKQSSYEVKTAHQLKSPCWGKKAVGTFSITQDFWDFCLQMVSWPVPWKKISNHKLNSTGRDPQGVPTMENSFLWPSICRAEFIFDIAPLVLILNEGSIFLTSFVSFFKAKEVRSATPKE